MHQEPEQVGASGSVGAYNQTLLQLVRAGGVVGRGSKLG